MRRMIVAAALTLTLAPMALARQCTDDTPTAMRKYTDIRRRMDAADAAVRTKAEAVKALVPAIKTASDAYVAANQAVMQKRASEPQKDIPGTIWNSRSPANAQAHEAWEREMRTATETRTAKLDAFRTEFHKLGRYNNEFNAGEVRDRAIEVLRTLEDLAPAAQFEAAVNAVIQPGNGVDDYAQNRVAVSSLPMKSGLLGACYVANEERRRARREEAEYADMCQVAATIYNVNVLQGRNGDGSEIVAGRNDGNQGATRNTSPTGQHRGGVLTGETRNTSGTTANVSTTGNVSPTSNVSPTANVSRTNAEIYTVKPGDNLSKIARELAPRLGNPPISELVSRLYANMTTRSRSNPNLIFAGDTINIAAVRAELQG